MLWPYCSHDGIPCGGEDVSVVVALIMSLQLLGEVLSGQLKKKKTESKSMSHHRGKTSFLHNRDNHWTQGLSIFLVGTDFHIRVCLQVWGLLSHM